MGIILQLFVTPAVAGMTIDGTPATGRKSVDVPPIPLPSANPDARNQGTSITIGPDEIRDFNDAMKVERMGPSAEVLIQLAKRFPPPKAWWDEDFEGL